MSPKDIERARRAAERRGAEARLKEEAKRKAEIEADRRTSPEERAAALEAQKQEALANEREAQPGIWRASQVRKKGGHRDNRRHR
jgi:hypothetical protein